MKDQAINLKNTINFKQVTAITFVEASKVNIYLYDTKQLSSINLFKLAKKWLHKNELPLFDKRKKETAKKEYLASRFIIKQLVSTSPAYNYDELYVQFNHQKNKLQIYDKDELLPFSLCISHSNGLVLVVASHNEISLGVDIEKIKLSRDYQALAKSFYHIDESALIETLATKEQGINTFYRLWTLKEALSKTLRQPMTTILKEETLSQLSAYSVNSGVFLSEDSFDISIITAEINQPNINQTRENLIISVLNSVQLTYQVSS